MGSKKKAADLEHVDPATLVPWARNPRDNEAAVAPVAHSIERFGFGAPVVARPSDRRVLAGHTRIKAALSLGIKKIPVRWLELADGEADAFSLADNRLGEIATFDDAGLLALLEEQGADVADLGWSEAEVAALLAGVDANAANAGAAEDDDDLDEDAISGLPPIPEGAAKAPFPWFGGKRRVAGAVWQALGDVDLYVEPFAGSLACLLARPRIHVHALATVNDADAYVANFFRALKAAPDEVARWADDRVDEVDLLARHRWLVSTGRERLDALERDPEHYDAQVAGWWCWGLACWIGSGWCAAETRGDPVTGDGAGQGVHRKLPHLGDAGRGVHRKRPHLGDAGRGVHRKRPHVSDAGQGVHRAAGAGTCAERRVWVEAWFRALADRLRNARVCCGDWSRVVTLGGTCNFASVGVLLDPPYGGEDVDRERVYGIDDLAGLSGAVRAWALRVAAEDPRYRIALCGYEEEHGSHMPASWRQVAWASKGAMQRRATAGTTRTAENAKRERLWFSPSCLPVALPADLAPNLAASAAVR